MTEQVMNKIFIRWLCFIVATLAVAPVFAQTPPPTWATTCPRFGGCGSPPQHAQTPGPASNPGDTRAREQRHHAGTEIGQRSTEITQRSFVR